MAPLDPKAANSNPLPESKSAKKKKAKAEVAQTQQPPPASTESENGVRHDSAAVGANGTEDSNESPYIKELQKYASTSNPKLSRSQA